MTVWFITGASRGIGREIVQQALARGDRVAATLRRPEQLDDLAAVHGERLWRAKLDVTDTEQLDHAVAEAFGAHDRIDHVVSNVGSGIFGAAEDLTDEQVETSIATNLVAAIHFSRRVVPRLREQGGGTLVQMSSQGGHITFPGFAIYHAAKWGIEGYFESLAAEIEPFGIKTVLVEPGMVRTSFYDAAQRVNPSSPYLAGPTDRPAIPLENMVGSQSGLAHAVIEAVTQGDPPLRLLLNSDAYDAVTSTVAERLEALRGMRDVAYAADAEYLLDTAG